MTDAAAGEAAGTDVAGFLGGRLLLRQPRGGHRAGTDALLLVAAARRHAASAAPAHVVDLGAGVGTAGLALALAWPGAHVALVERGPALAELARANAAANGLENRVAVIEADVTAPAPALRAVGLAGGSADLVVANPPFHDPARHRASPDAERAGAYLLAPEALAPWIATAARLLVPGGRFVLIHRADAVGWLGPLLAERFGALTLRFVHPAADRPALRLLIGGVKGRRTAPVVLPPLILHASDGRFTPEAEALHRGDKPG